MLVDQTNRRGCSIVSRRPAKALGASLVAFWIVAMAESASERGRAAQPHPYRICAAGERELSEPSRSPKV
jgi:hypothetical protein